MLPILIGGIFFLHLVYVINSLNQLEIYKKWSKVFAQRKEATGEVTLYPEDQLELLHDILNSRLFNYTKINEN
jgi:hypothetical protein